MVMDNDIFDDAETWTNWKDNSVRLLLFIRHMKELVDEADTLTELLATEFDMADIDVSAEKLRDLL